jgi:hypothetical protein
MRQALGTAFPSFTSKLLQSSDGNISDAERDDLTLWTAGALYAAGADTVRLAYRFMSH